MLRSLQQELINERMGRYGSGSPMRQLALESQIGAELARSGNDASSLYLSQHWPQYAGRSRSAPATGRMARPRSNRPYGGGDYAPYYGGYSPQFIAAGAAGSEPMVGPTGIGTIYTRDPSWSAPMTVAAVRQSQLAAGAAPEIPELPGRVPTKSGYAYIGSKSGYGDDYEAWLAEQEAMAEAARRASEESDQEER